MNGNSKASFVCNQVLRVIKESDLNYLVNETPYSAFITIRKKFLKTREVHEASENTLACDAMVLSDVVLRQENIALRQQFKELERDKCQLKMNIEALEVKNEAPSKKVNGLESDNSSLGIRLEVAKGHISNQNDKLETQIEKIKDIEAEKETIDVILKKRETKVKKLEGRIKETEDDLLICESTLKNRDSQIEKLKHELDKLKNLHYCEECDFSSATDTELKCHIGEQHEHQCPYCDCKFVGEKKLKNHLCRVYVKNPCSEQFGFYTKDWFERQKCIRIFEKASKEEVIILHSEYCVEQKVCLELPLNFKKEKHF